MELPNSDTSIEQKTGEIYLFSIYEEADVFYKIKESNQLKKNNNLKTYSKCAAEFYQAINWQPVLCIAGISGTYFPGNCNYREYNLYYLTNYGCDNQISSACLSGGINGIGLYVTLCENTILSGRKCYLYVAPGENTCVNVTDYVMVKNFYKNILEQSGSYNLY